jgi:biopolymer transport protein TolR
MTPTRSRTDTAMAEINVTPMCDVMIVLLIIFMVTTPLLNETPGLEPPAARRADPRDDRDDSTVLVLGDGRIQMAGEQFASAGELMIRLQGRLAAAEGASPMVRVKADRDLRYGQVTAVLDACRAAGAERVTLLTVREPGL